MALRIVTPYIANGGLLDSGQQQTFLESIESTSVVVDTNNLRPEAVTIFNIDWTENPHVAATGEAHDSGAGSYTFNTESYALITNGSIDCRVTDLDINMSEGDVIVMYASVLTDPLVANEDDEFGYRFYITYDTSTTVAVGPEFIYSMQSGHVSGGAVISSDTVNYQRANPVWVYIHEGDAIVLNRVSLRAFVRDGANSIDIYHYNISCLVSKH